MRVGFQQSICSLALLAAMSAMGANAPSAPKQSLRLDENPQVMPSPTAGPKEAAPPAAAPPTPEQAPTPSSKPKGTRLTAIQVKVHDNSTQDLVLVTSGTVSNYETQELANPARFVVDLHGVSVAKHDLKEPHSSALGTIRVGVYEDKTRVVIDLAQGVSGTPTIHTGKHGLQISFQVSAHVQAPAPVPMKRSPLVKQKAPTPVPPPAPAPAAPAPVKQPDLISLDLQNADIQAVLRLIGEASGMNIVASEKVTGKVTVKLNHVPWKDALQAVVDVVGCKFVESGSVIRVMPISKHARHH